MDEYIDFEGKTTQEALDLAVEKTGLSPSNLKFEIVHPGGGGIFGISFKKAKIRVFLDDEKEKPQETPDKPEPKPKKRVKKPDIKEPENATLEKKEPVKPANRKVAKVEKEELPAETATKADKSSEKEARPEDEPPRSTWARPTSKAELPQKEKKTLEPEDLIKPRVPKNRIDVDLRDERDIRRAAQRKKRSKRPERPSRYDRREKYERPERPERSERSERADRDRAPVSGERVRIPSTQGKEDSSQPKDIEEEFRVIAEEALKELLEFWMDEGNVESGWRDGKIYLNILGDGSGLLIGRKGQTLDAIQFIIGKIVDRKAGRHLRLMVDTENYRKKREQVLERTAVQLAEKALSSKKGQTTGPMNPHDRRIIHLTLQEDGRFRTRSRGEGTYKRVLISLK